MRRAADRIAGLILAGLAAGTLGAVSTSAAPAGAASTDLKSEGPTQPAKVQDGQYTDKNGDPTYHVTDGGKKVD